MMEDLLRVLRAADVTFDDRDMADALWLARLLPEGAPYIDPPGDRLPKPIDDTVNPSSVPQDVEDISADESPKSSDPNFRPVAVDPRSLLDGPSLYGGAGKASAANDGDIRVSRVRVPSAPGLHDALALARSLRPLAKRFPSRHQFLLDEEATAELSAEARTLMPVLRAARERRFEVALVVEDLPSMALWRRVIAEFHRLLQQQGAFRDVRRWTLSLSGGKAHLIDPTGGVRSPSELRHSEGRRLILLVSDCLSPAWYGRAIAELLADWGASTPVAVLQLLPEHLWTHTALGPTDARLHALVPGTPNAQLNVERAWWDDDPIDAQLPMPVLTLDEKSLGEWSRLLMGVGTRARGVLMARPSQIADAAVAGTQDDTVMPAGAEERLQRFRSLVSFEAFRLAAFLAAVPLSLPVMRLVQSAMFARPSESQMAEVVLGGIIERVTPLDATVDDDQVAYEFAATADDVAGDAGSALRAGLLRSIRRSELQRVIDAVSQYVSDRAGSAVDFHAWVENDAGTDVLPAMARPFARLAHSALERLGVRVSNRVMPGNPKPPVTPPEFIEEEVLAEGLTIMRRVALPESEHHQVAWSPDGKRIAVRGNIGRDHHIWVIDAASGETSGLRVSDDTAITAMVWSQSSMELAFAVNSAYGGAGVFVQSLPLPDVMEPDAVPPIVTENPIDDLDWRASPNEIVVAHDTGFVEFFRKTGETTWSSIQGAGTMVGSGRPVAAVSWSRSAEMFAALYVDGGVRTFQQSDRLMIVGGSVGLTIPMLPGAPVHSSANAALLAWQPRGEWLAFVQPSGLVQIASPSLEKIAELRSPDSERRVHGVSTSRDGAFVATISDFELILWRSSDWSVVSSTRMPIGLTARIPDVRPMAFSPVDSVLVVSANLGELLLLRVDEAALASRAEDMAQTMSLSEDVPSEEDDVGVAERHGDTAEFFVVISSYAREPEGPNPAPADQFLSWLESLGARHVRRHGAPSSLQKRGVKTHRPPTASDVAQSLRHYIERGIGAARSGSRTRLTVFYDGDGGLSPNGGMMLTLKSDGNGPPSAVQVDDLRRQLAESQAFDEIVMYIDCSMMVSTAFGGVYESLALRDEAVGPGPTAKAKQFSFESRTRANSRERPFTDALVRGLMGAAASASGEVMTRGLSAYVDREIKKLPRAANNMDAQFAQRPALHHAGDDFVLTHVERRSSSRLRINSDPIFAGRTVNIQNQTEQRVASFEYDQRGNAPDVVTIAPGMYSARFAGLPDVALFQVSGDGQPVDVPLPWTKRDIRVLVAGTGNRRLSPSEDRASRALGRSLAHWGMQLITGGWPGVDKVVGETFARELEKQDAEVTNFFTQVLKENQDVELERGALVRVASYNDEVLRSLEGADVIVAIGGKGGTAEILERGRRLGLPTIPWAATGGDAEAAFAQQLEASDTPLDRMWLQVPIADEASANATADRIAELVVELVNQRWQNHGANAPETNA